MSAAVLEAPPHVLPPVPMPLDSDALYEVVDGQVVELPAISALSALIGTDFAVEIGMHLKTRRTGRVVQEALFPTLRRRRRRPDVAYISFERWPVDRPIPASDPWPVSPDLAVEVASLSDTAEDLLEKVREYHKAHVREVWIVLLHARQVQVFPATGRPRILLHTDELEGGEVLPGFRVALETLFPEQPPLPEREEVDAQG
jgi:Uma2 family endonuclease